MLRWLVTHQNLLLETGTCPGNGEGWHWEPHIAAGLWLTLPEMEHKPSATIARTQVTTRPKQPSRFCINPVPAGLQCSNCCLANISSIKMDGKTLIIVDTSDTGIKLVRYLCNVVWSILFQVYRPSDLEVGFTIQVGGLDEADLHSSKQNLCAAASVTTS